MAQNNENGSYSNIPDDLALSILSKLPLKSLKRFTCVKKSWSLLFDNPNFMSMFRRNFISNCHYGNDSSLLLSRTVNSTGDPRGPFYGDPRELVWISGERLGEKVNLDQISLLEPPLKETLFHLFGFGNGIHGIICISVYYFKLSTVLLWNPATGESLIVSPSPFNSNPPPSDYAMPSDYAIVQCGFGYDHVGDDYKLIQCIYSCWTNEFNNIWEIYSVRSNTWRKLDVNMAYAEDVNGFLRYHVYLNGVCHWKAYKEMHLVSFNLSTEVVLLTPYPIDKRDDRMNVVLDVLNGSIALISNQNNSICVSILVEIGVEESWTKLFTFEPLPCNLKFVLGVGNKGDILYLKNDNDLASFDLSTQMVEEIAVKGEDEINEITIYKKSLLPIRRINN